MKFSRDYVRTGGVGDRETTDLDRRSADSVGLHWKIKEVDYTKNPPVYRAERGDSSNEDQYNLTDWLPAAGSRAQGDVDTHYLEVGERVVMLSEGGEMATAHLLPAGTYTQNDDQKPGTTKAGVWHKKFNNGQEISFDRETGDFKITCKGQQKDSSSSSSSGSSGSSSTSSSSGGGEIKGTVTLEAADGTFTMANGEIKGTMDGASFSLKSDAFTLSVGGCTFKFSGSGFEQTGGEQKHDGHDVGKTHKHTETQPGGGLSGVPQ